MPNFYWVGGWTGNTGFNSGYSSGSGIWTSVINGATSASGDYAFGPYYWGFWQNWRVQGPSNTLVAALTGGQSGSVSLPGQPGVTGWLPSGPRSANIGDSVFFGYPNFITTTSYLSSQIVENSGGGGVGYQNRGIACLFGGLNLNDQWLGASGQGRTGPINRIEISQYGCTSGETHQLDGVYPDYILDGGLTGIGFTSGPAGYGMYRNSRFGLFRVNQIGFDVGEDTEQITNTVIPTGFTADSSKRIPLAIIGTTLINKNNNLMKIIIRNASATAGSKLDVENTYNSPETSCPMFENTRFSNISELHLLGGTAGYILNRNGTKLNVDQFTIYNGLTAFTYKTSVEYIVQDSTDNFISTVVSKGKTSGDAGINVGKNVTIRGGINIKPTIIRSNESSSSIENYSDGQTVYRIKASCPSLTLAGGLFYLGNASISGEGGGICVPSIIDNNSTIQYSGVKNGVHVELGSEDGITSSYGTIIINDTNYGSIDPTMFNRLGMNLISGPTGNGRRSNVILKLKHADIALLNANKGHILPSFESDESSIIRIADGYLKSDAWLSTIYPFSESYQGFQLGMSADASGNASDGIRVDSYDVRVNFAKGTNVKINTTAVGPT